MLKLTQCVQVIQIYVLCMCCLIIDFDTLAVSLTEADPLSKGAKTHGH